MGCTSPGLKVLAQKVPEGLVTGLLPISCQVAAPPGSARRKAVPKVPPARAESKWRYSAEDLQKIKYYLEEEQLPSDTASKNPRQMPRSFLLLCCILAVRWLGKGRGLFPNCAVPKELESCMAARSWFCWGRRAPCCPLCLNAFGFSWW